MTLLSRSSIAALALAACAMAQAQQAADNTKQNALDSTNRSASADKQKNNSTDLALVQQIRKSVMADKSLSTYAHNVKIVATDGNVTLNGVVRSDEEKRAVEAKAKTAVAEGSVTSNLKVAP